MEKIIFNICIAVLMAIYSVFVLLIAWTAISIRDLTKKIRRFVTLGGALLVKEDGDVFRRKPLIPFDGIGIFTLKRSPFFFGRQG